MCIRDSYRDILCKGQRLERLGPKLKAVFVKGSHIEDKDCREMYDKVLPQVNSHKELWVAMSERIIPVMKLAQRKTQAAKASGGRKNPVKDLSTTKQAVRVNSAS